METKADAAGDSALLDQYKSQYGHVAHGGKEVRIPVEQTLYEALRARHLLEKYDLLSSSSYTSRFDYPTF